MSITPTSPKRTGPHPRGTAANLDWVLEHVCDWNIILDPGTHRYVIDGTGIDVDEAVYKLDDQGWVTLLAGGLVGPTAAGKAHNAANLAAKDRTVQAQGSRPQHVPPAAQLVEQFKDVIERMVLEDGARDKDIAAHLGVPLRAVQDARSFWGIPGGDVVRRERFHNDPTVRAGVVQMVAAGQLPFGALTNLAERVALWRLHRDAGMGPRAFTRRYSLCSRTMRVIREADERQQEAA